MISLVNLSFIIFYLYLAVYIFTLNHRSYSNYVFGILNLNLAIAAFAGILVHNAANYGTAFFWMKIHQYAILPIPILFALGVSLILYPEKEKAKNMFLGAAAAIAFFWMLEIGSSGETTFYLYRLNQKFRWESRIDTGVGLLLTLMYLLATIPAIAMSFLLLQRWIKKKVGKYSKRISVLLALFIFVYCDIAFYYFVVKKDGTFDSFFYFLTAGLPLGYIYYVVFQERKLPLHMLNSYSLDIMNSFKEGIIMLDKDYNVRRLNIFAQKKLGWMEGESYSFASLQEDCMKLILEAKMNGNKEIINQECFLKAKDGTKIHVVYSFTELRKRSNRISKYLFWFMDISERIKKEEILKQKNRELYQDIENRTELVYQKSRELSEETSKKEEHRHRIEYFLENDYLTKLHNKSGFLNTVSFDRTISEPALISVNILNLKMISETFSRLVSEKGIVKIAEFLKENWEEIAIIARFENSRFLLYCESKDYPYIAGSIISKFQKPFLIEGLSVEIDCGIGIAYSHDEYKDINQLILESDLAANQAKKYGKNKFYIYRDDLETRKSSEFSLINDHLYAALNNEELYLSYDLQYDSDGKAIGIQVHLNWNNPQVPDITEQEIMEVAEKFNFSQDLERWRIRNLIQDMKHLMVQNDNYVLPVMVPLLQSTFYSEDYLQELVNIIEEYSMDKSLFSFSFGEDIFQQTPEFINERLEMIKSLGIHAGLKNFSGLYASLRFLKDVKIEFLVLAPEFVEGIGTSETDEAILQMILEMAKNLDYQVLVQNVSRKNQFDFLRNRCQGFSGKIFLEPCSICQICHQLETKGLLQLEKL